LSIRASGREIYGNNEKLAASINVINHTLYIVLHRAEFSILAMSSTSPCLGFVKEQISFSEFAVKANS